MTAEQGTQQALLPALHRHVLLMGQLTRLDDRSAEIQFEIDLLGNAVTDLGRLLLKLNAGRGRWLGQTHRRHVGCRLNLVRLAEGSGREKHRETGDGK